jgi:hypothetical protein
MEDSEWNGSFSVENKIKITTLFDLFPSLGCGGEFEANYGTLQTPNYPGPYPQNTECMWKIAVDWDKSVELTITDLDMEHSQDCNFDYVKVCINI